jgi:hypothetical protein
MTRHTYRRCLLLAPILLAVASTAVGGSRYLQVAAPDSWLPGIPVLVRIEIRNEDGSVARDVWDATAALSATSDGVTLTPATVVLRNGLGSALVTIGAAAGTPEIEINAAANDLGGSRTLRSLEGQPEIAVTGELGTGLTEWSGIVHVTGNLVVPAGATLRVLAGTLVLIDGVATDEAGYSIVIKGTLECVGTAEQPITFTARNPARPWGEIDHDGASPSLYQHTILTRGGNSDRGGHTNTGPIVRADNSTITFENSSLADTKGKTMTASGSELAFYDCLFTRSVMGPEIGGTGLVLERSWIEEMYGTDDNDGIYLHDQQAGQTITLHGCVVASGDDDAVDTLGSVVTIDDCILRDFHGLDQDAKGVSVLAGETDITRCLIVDCKVGVSGKVQSQSQQCIVKIDRTTIVGDDVAFQAYNKYGIANAKIYFYVSNTIARAPDAVYTDYLASDIHVSYSDLSEAWDGTGNITDDPLFVDAAAKDFRLQESSPCIDTGDPASPLDPDGTRADMGYFPFTHEAAEPRFIRGRVNDDQTTDLSDVVMLLLHLFGDRSIPCAKADDINDDGNLNVADAVYLLDFLYADGLPLDAPTDACDVDAVDDTLDCASFSCP